MTEKEILKEILTELKSSKNDNQIQPLWTLDDIAYYLNVSKRTLENNKITKQKDFPSPIEIPQNKGKMHPRWHPHEVKKWINRKRGINRAA